MTREQEEFIEDRIRRIIALCENPHYGTERRWTILERAKEVRAVLASQATAVSTAPAQSLQAVCPRCCTEFTVHTREGVKNG